ncbi:MAG: hypothetical protein V4598_09020 [Bdellovibrionota bacterium]
MKFISALLALCFTMNVFASTGAMDDLSTAMDEYQFAMTVEWDQKDQAFKTKQLEVLSGKMGQLFKQGLTAQDVNVLIDNRFKNSQVAQAAKVKLALLGNNLTPANVLDILKDNSSDIYSNGASWNGNTTLFVWGGVVVAIIAIAVAYSKWQNDNYECVETAIADYCTDAYDCHGSSSETSSGSCYYAGTRCGSYERCIKEVRTDVP